MNKKSLQEFNRMMHFTENLVKAFPNGLIKIQLESGKEIYCEPSDYQDVYSNVRILQYTVIIPTTGHSS